MRVSFINGDRDGTHKIWYKNGQLGNVNFYKNDKLEGEQISYFESGNLWQSLHYVNGYEEGKQKPGTTVQGSLIILQLKMENFMELSEDTIACQWCKNNIF